MRAAFILLAFLATAQVQAIELNQRVTNGAWSGVVCLQVESETKAEKRIYGMNGFKDSNLSGMCFSNASWKESERVGLPGETIYRGVKLEDQFASKRDMNLAFILMFMLAIVCAGLLYLQKDR